MPKPHPVYFIPCNTDYDEGPVEEAREAELSEDTDYDGSSLPEDSPEVQISTSIRHNQALPCEFQYLNFQICFSNNRVHRKPNGKRRALTIPGMKSKIFSFLFFFLHISQFISCNEQLSADERRAARGRRDHMGE